MAPPTTTMGPMPASVLGLRPAMTGGWDGVRHSGRCGLARPPRLQERIVRKAGGSARRRASKRRMTLERRRRELLQ